MGFIHLRSVLKRLNILNVELLIMMSYFYNKCPDTFNEWRDNFKGDIFQKRYFFSDGTTSSCSVIIGYLGNKKFSINKICKENNGRVLIIEAEIEAETFSLLNLYNSNSDTEQLQTLSDVDLPLSEFSLDDT